MRGVWRRQPGLQEGLRNVHQTYVSRTSADTVLPLSVEVTGQVEVNIDVNFAKLDLQKGGDN